MKIFCILWFCLLPGLTVAQATIEGATTTIRLNTVPLFPPKPDIHWPYMSDDDTLVRTNSFFFRVCIDNSSAGDPVQVFVNGLDQTKNLKPQTNQANQTSTSNSIFKQETSPCGTGIFYTLQTPLREGVNLIKVIAVNATDTVTRTLNVKYYKREKRLALVIGNAAYQGAALTNPINDANSLARLLATDSLQFTVIKRTDLTRDEMLFAVYDFAEQLKRDPDYTAGLIYYAGHGFQIDGQNYLAPIDAINAKLPTEKDNKTLDSNFAMRKNWLRIRCIRTDDILDLVNSTQVPIKIFLLDACRNNPFKNQKNMSIDLSEGLAETRAQPVGSIIGYATAPGSKADDGDGSNGLYTKYVIKNFKIPNVPLKSVFDNILEDVKNNSRNNLQKPYFLTSGVGNFYLFRN